MATDNREKGEIPQIQHISNFIRKRVKAEFAPDFGDVYKSEVFKDRRGIYSNQRGSGKKPKCFVCQGEHRVEECPTMADCTVEERESNTQWRTDCVSLALLEDISLENADQRRNVARMAILKCTIQFSMHPPPPPPPPPRYQPRAKWSSICLG